MGDVELTRERLATRCHGRAVRREPTLARRRPLVVPRRRVRRDRARRQSGIPRIESKSSPSPGRAARPLPASRDRRHRCTTSGGVVSVGVRHGVERYCDARHERWDRLRGRARLRLALAPRDRRRDVVSCAGSRPRVVGRERQRGRRRGRRARCLAARAVHAPLHLGR